MQKRRNRSDFFTTEIFRTESYKTKQSRSVQKIPTSVNPPERIHFKNAYVALFHNRSNGIVAAIVTEEQFRCIPGFAEDSFRTAVQPLRMKGLLVTDRIFPHVAYTTNVQRICGVLWTNFHVISNVDLLVQHVSKKNALNNITKCLQECVILDLGRLL